MKNWYEPNGGQNPSQPAVPPPPLAPSPTSPAYGQTFFGQHSQDVGQDAGGKNQQRNKNKRDRGGGSRTTWSSTFTIIGVAGALIFSVVAVVITYLNDGETTVIREVAAPPAQVSEVSTAEAPNTTASTEAPNTATVLSRVVEDTGDGTVIEQAAEKVVEATVKLETESGGGSGFIYSTEGYIITAAHVLTGPDGTTFDTVTVGLTRDGNIVRRVEGEVIGLDDRKDIGVVRIDRSLDFSIAELGSNAQVRIGETVIAVGSPFGLENTVTRGIVSALNRTVTSPGTGEVLGFNLIQTDAPINSGNSGGPLANLNGQIIGVNILIQNSGVGGNVGIGFAVPIAQATQVADEIIRGVNTEEFGFLGISGRTSTIGRAGALVADVTPGEPADRAGVRVGDLIVAVDGEAIFDFNDLLTAVQLHKPNDVIVLEVIRQELDDNEEVTSEETLDLQLTLGSRPEPVSS